MSSCLSQGALVVALAIALVGVGCGASGHGSGPPSGVAGDASGASSSGGSSSGEVDASMGADASLDGALADSSSSDAVVSTDGARHDGAAGSDASSRLDGASTGPDAGLASFLLGADISSVQQAEDSGEHFYDTDGTEKDILQILKNHGFNSVRLRTFVAPLASDGYDTMNGITTGYCDTAHTVTMGARVKAAGMGFLLDFHLSDNWADPGHQVIPLAWQADTLPQLEAQVQSYTQSVVSQLVDGGARPDIVQIGNEITPGVLLPMGSNATNFVNLGALLKAGIAGVKAVDPTIQIMMHIDRGGDNETTTWWVNGVMGQGVSFDVLGESCYTNYQGAPATWQANFAKLVTSFPNLSFVIAEYDEDAADLAGNTECAPSTGPCNVWRQANDIAFGIPGKKGFGTFIWEPTYYEETLFDGTGRTAGLTDPFSSGARISLYDQMAATYGL